MGYVCHCAKLHNLTSDNYDLIDGTTEVRLQCNHCDFDIIIGADSDVDYDGIPILNMYSFDVKEIKVNRDERLNLSYLIVSEGENIRMDCGHYADWVGYAMGANYCCSKCAFDKNGQGTGNKEAWQRNYEEVK